MEYCGIDVSSDRLIIVGAQDVPGFEAVALGQKVDTAKVEPGIVALAKKTLGQHPNARAFILECTEMPPYSDAIRKATGLPVFDAITNCDFFIKSLDYQNFGKNDRNQGYDEGVFGQVQK